MAANRKALVILSSSENLRKIRQRLCELICITHESLKIHELCKLICLIDEVANYAHIIGSKLRKMG
jgi:hypothetical protein